VGKRFIVASTMMKFIHDGCNDPAFSTLKVINECTVTEELTSLPAFQAIQHFKSLPDFLMFLAFLALLHRNNTVSASPHERILPSMGIIHVIMAFVTFRDQVQKRSRSASEALKYTCQNFVVHLSQAPKPWDDTLQHISFWNNHLISWLDILFEGQKLAKVCIPNDFRDSTPDLLLGTSSSPSLTVTAVSSLKLSNLCKTATTRRSLSFTDEEIFVTSFKRYYTCRSLDGAT
jgi:hypothetical protein